MKRKILEFILIILFLLLQCTFGRVISLAGVSPNLLLILPVLFGFLNGSNEGIFVGFISGLLYDFFSTGLVGFAAFVFMFLGYFGGLFYQKYEEREIFIPACLIFVGNFVFGFATYVGGFLLFNKLDVLFYMKNIIMPESVYTLIVGMVIYPLIRVLNKLFNKQERKRVDILDERNI